MTKRKNFSKGSSLLIIIALVLVLLIIFFAFKSAKASSGPNDLAGRILLQVEDQGQAWYLNPDNFKKYYLGRPDEAQALFKEFSLALEPQILNDYLREGFPPEMAGRLFTNRQESYEIYYINPLDLKGYSVDSPWETFLLMQNLSLGVSNDDLRSLKTYNCIVDGALLNESADSCKDSLEIIVSEPETRKTFSHVIDLEAKVEGADNIKILEQGLLWDSANIPNLSLEPSLKVVAENSSEHILVQLRDMNPASHIFYRFYFMTSDKRVIESSVHSFVNP